MPRWTPEARERQRQLILNRKPWLSSTGAKTPEGKAIFSQNARKILSPEEEEFKTQMLDLKALCAQSKETKKKFIALNKEYQDLLKQSIIYI
jgi:hypothetical protein